MWWTLGLRRPSGVREVAVLVCAAAAVALLAWTALSTISRTRDFEAQRRERLLPAEERPHVLLGSLASEPSASALRAAERVLGPGDRFALLIPPGIDRSTAGTYRLLANAYLYPAVAVADPSGADVVIGLFGGGAELRQERETVFASGDAWVGSR
jgi:hypothetical protein